MALTKPVQKRGIFFTSIAVIISAVLVLTFAVPTTVTTKDQLPLTQAKADAVSGHARDLKHSYLPQALYVAAYNSLYALSEYLRLKGAYFSGPDANFNLNMTLKEMIVNGTMCCGLDGSCNSDVKAEVLNPAIHKGVDQCLGKELMKDRNFTRLLDAMENASFRALRVSTAFDRNFTSMAFHIYQDNGTGPWQVGINLTITYLMAAGDVIINNTENITTMFSIEGIPDPLYAVESPAVAQDGNVLYTNYFNMTNITDWNVSNFYRQVEWRFYRHDRNGSSFLSRFYGRDEPSECCGVESLINPMIMASVNGIRERPYIDWCYYGSGNRCSPDKAGSWWNITCVTTDIDGTSFYRFAVDTYHALQYNLSNDQKDYLYAADAPPPCPETPFP